MGWYVTSGMVIGMAHTDKATYIESKLLVSLEQCASTHDN